MVCFFSYDKKKKYLWSYMFCFCFYIIGVYFGFCFVICDRYGLWVVCFMYGVWFGVKGFEVVGKILKNFLVVAKVCEFLLLK